MMKTTSIVAAVLITLATDAFCAGAFDYLCDNIGSANLEDVAGASRSDIDFLADILNDPVYAELIQVSSATQCPLMFIGLIL